DLLLRHRSYSQRRAGSSLALVAASFLAPSPDAAVSASGDWNAVVAAVAQRALLSFFTVEVRSGCNALPRSATVVFNNGPFLRARSAQQKSRASITGCQQSLLRPLRDRCDRCVPTAQSRRGRTRDTLSGASLLRAHVVTRIGRRNLGIRRAGREDVALRS